MTDSNSALKRQCQIAMMAHLVKVLSALESMVEGGNLLLEVVL